MGGRAQQRSNDGKTNLAYLRVPAGRRLLQGLSGVPPGASQLGRSGEWPCEAKKGGDRGGVGREGVRDEKCLVYKIQSISTGLN